MVPVPLSSIAPASASNNLLHQPAKPDRQIHSVLSSMRGEDSKIQEPNSALFSSQIKGKWDTETSSCVERSSVGNKILGREASHSILLPFYSDSYLSVMNKCSQNSKHLNSTIAFCGVQQGCLASPQNICKLKLDSESILIPHSSWTTGCLQNSYLFSIMRAIVSLLFLSHSHLPSYSKLLSFLTELLLLPTTQVAVTYWSVIFPEHPAIH